MSLLASEAVSEEQSDKCSAQYLFYLRSRVKKVKTDQSACP